VEVKPPSKTGIKPIVPVIARPAAPVEDEDDSDKRGKPAHKGKQLVYDEKAGRVVAKRKHKKNRRRPTWDSADEEDIFSDL
jgi:hypothetical protein